MSSSTESALERDRLTVLHDLGILDTVEEERFDRITRLASRLFDVPMSLVSLVDEGRQWFKSHYGLTLRETPRTVSFCSHAIRRTDVFVIEDTHADERFADNPLVVGPPHIRFYAGRPLRGPGGHLLGTFNIMDTRPRRLTADELDVLDSLTAWAEAELAVSQLRDLTRDLDDAHEAARRANDELTAIARARTAERNASAAQLQLLEDFSATLNRTDRDLEAVLDVVVQHLIGSIADGAAIMLVDDGRRWLDIVALRHADRPELKAFRDAPSDVRAPVEGTFVEALIDADAPIVLDRDGVVSLLAQNAGTPRNSWNAFVEHVPMEHYVGVPLRVRSEVIGALGLIRTDPQLPFSASEAAFAQLLADRAAPVIAFARRDAALRASEERFRRLAENAADVIYRYRVHPELQVEYASPAFERVTGYRPDEVYADASILARVVHPDDLPTLQWALSHPGEAAEHGLVVRWMHRDGAMVWVEHRSVAVRHEGRVVAVEGIARDITELKRTQEQLAHQAVHDPLTGLANRVLFVDELRLALRRLERHPGTVGVLLVDLDRFKVVNDSLGHEVGDQLLVSIAERLRDGIRPTDVPARLGGDEFGILVTDADSVEDVVRVASRIQIELRSPVDLGGQEAFATASIGIACSEDPAEDPADLLRHADVAMYRAKAAGRSRYELFDEGLRSTIRTRLQTENDLHRAIERGELRVLYQPVFELATGDVVAAEALVRWQRDGELVGADRFIYLAEETGLVVPIGQWVLERACEQASRWRDARPGRPLTVHVNLSGRQLAVPDVADQIVDTMRRGGADHQLCLEITESVLMAEPEAAAEQLRRLRAGGLLLAIDDFGTGYSSLAYLKRFPIDRLKIDRSFVNGLGETDDDTAIVQAITSLAHTLDIEVIAEGVETASQLAALREIGCEEAQGFLLSRPVAAEAVDTLLLDAAH